MTFLPHTPGMIYSGLSMPFMLFSLGCFTHFKYIYSFFFGTNTPWLATFVIPAKAGIQKC